jgi:hypothetical protein
MPSRVPKDHGSRQWLDEYPDLCAELDPDLNDVDPGEIRYGSGRRLHWRCPKGPDHVWIQRVCNRTRGGGCPFCAGVRVSVTNSLATRYPEIAKQWHPTKNGKRTPHDVVGGAIEFAWWRCERGPDHVWRARVAKRTLDGSGCPACAGFQVSVTNCLATLFPSVAKEWHPSRNGGLTPRKVVAGCTRVVWWRCRAVPAHVWRAMLHDRTAGGTGCPYCARGGPRTSRGARRCEAAETDGLSLRSRPPACPSACSGDAGARPRGSRGV